MVCLRLSRSPARQPPQIPLARLEIRKRVLVKRATSWRTGWQLVWSKSVVVGAITKIQSAIDEDARLRQKVKRDLVSITLELEMMQSFLDDANEEMKNNLVRTWVKHIRQLAYDVEDCVEKVVQLDDKPIFWRRLLPSWMAPPLPLDQAVEELEQLKCRVEDVNNCYRRYNLINFESAAGSSSKLADGTTAYQMMLTDARRTTKRHHSHLDDLTSHIITNKVHKHLQVISLWGSASHDFIHSLMAQFYSNSCKEEEKAATVGMHVLSKMDTTHAHLFKEFEHLVTQKTYLIVLEGMSNMVEWDVIRTFLPHSEEGSCIIVSTQQLEIASLCIGHSYQILELKQFSPQHSVCAFFKEPRVRKASQKREAEDWMMDQPLVGRESQIRELRKYVGEAHNNSSHVVSVWGMAGVGKSSLVRHFYFDMMLHGHQFDKFNWVDVSYPFNLRSFLRSLLSDFESEKDPVQECRHLLEQHKCLIVIDSLRSKEEWDLIQAALVSRASKSVIIVITTEASIAAYCTERIELMLNVQGLQALAAFNFFKKEVCKNNPLSPLKDNKHMYDLQELILKCGGFPGVITAIAGLLATKVDAWKDAADSLNRRFMHHLETNPEFNGLGGLFRQMHSIILNPPDFLKPCIFYLLIFPRDLGIQRRRLVRRWIAEGYSKQSVERHAEENADNFFSELVELNIFQQVQRLASTNTIQVYYQVNSFIREYISRQVEENLVYELSGDCAITTQSRGRHLIILRCWHRDRVVFERADFSRLWSLTVFGKWESFFISKSMKLLRVLDLENTFGVKDADLEKMVKLLHCLKFLSLRGCREVHHLPSSLGDLRQLQTLDVRHTSIVALPPGITKLYKLQYIRVGANLVSESTPSASSSSCLPEMCRRPHLAGAEAPRGIGKLTELHTLGVINVAAIEGIVILEELKKLTQLRKLGVSGINSKNSSKFLSAISDHVHLESLSAWLDKDSEGCLDDINQPLEDLRSLKLYGLGDKLPAAVSLKDLSKLTKLDLGMAALAPSDMQHLARLPKLRILRLHVKQARLQFLTENSGGEELVSYEKVKVLEISGSSTGLHVIFGSKSMQSLEHLKLDCSNWSWYHLSGLDHLSGIKEVLLTGTEDEAFRTDLQNQLRNHPEKPTVTLA
uniref:NBS-LRR disease resistance protein n=1 Tax=Dasypyrum villosum TaxID=40247 RepID=A0A8K1IBF2_9POAL|nr:NBS-LRR disease resistance protein [Dasypyrum villosum]